MASIIRVKRSTGTAAPSTINYGELAVTVGLATHGTFGGRLFAGDNNTPNPACARTPGTRRGDHGA